MNVLRKYIFLSLTVILFTCFTDKSTDELLSIWKSEAETVLTARHKEGTSIELYKVVAQRKVC